MENIYEKILFIKNQPLFEKPISYESHKIFYKYTSEKYYKYIFNLLETLCKRSPYENSSHIFHLSLSFIFKILYQCENTPHLSNLDLITLNCFSLGIKSLTKQKLFPSITRIKKIYEEKYKTYNNKEILEGEIICLKLLNYNINLLTPFEYVEYILYEEKNISIKKKVYEYLEDLIKNKLEFILYNSPFDIAKECINNVKNNLAKEPKIITKKIISTKTIKGKNLGKKYSSSEKMINSKYESNKINNNNNWEILEKLKRTNNISNSKYKQDIFISNIKINLKCSPERIYYKKSCNCNVIHPNSSELIINENSRDENNNTNKAKIFKKKINKNSVSKNKYMYKSNNMNNKSNEICQKRLNFNNNKNSNKSYYVQNSVNMNNTQYFRKTNNSQVAKENDKNYHNIFLQRNNSGNSGFNKNNKYSVESENINNYKHNRESKYEIETKNIKLAYLNRKHICGSDYKRTNNGNRLTQQKHNQLNSSGYFFDNSSCSKDENFYGSQSIGNYYIKW